MTLHNFARNTMSPTSTLIAISSTICEYFGLISILSSLHRLIIIIVIIVIIVAIDGMWKKTLLMRT